MNSATEFCQVCARRSMLNAITLLGVDSHRFRAYDRIKLAIDTLIAGFLFTLALPVMLLAGLLVKLTSRGPILYSQTRVGCFGRPFRIYKIRSMHHNSEAAGARWCTKADPRVTFIGKILRKTHIDELPQLWNILRGDMSLIGPRPERPEFIPVLDKAIEGYMSRLAIKPGLTGLAQIQLPPDTNLASVRKKLALDLVYIQRRSLWLDLRLYLGTAFYLIGCSYNTVRRLMQLPQVTAAPAMILRDLAVDPHAQEIPTPVRLDVTPAGAQPTSEMTSV
jgi:lipopolysaccharide/colanic/teichoic acid biosynthesis glycosyltransferase